MRNLTRRIVLLLAIALFVTAGSVFAQMDRGTITGTVTDQSGAVIAGVAVTATNTATGVSTSTKTEGGGAYTIPLLHVGPYQVTAEFHGFKKFLQSGIVLEVDQTVALDIHMELGAVTETVQVTAQPLLNKDTSDRGTVVSARDVEELPIVSQSEQRNPGFYMSLAPGVISRGTSTATASGSGRQLDTVVNGGTSGSTEFYLDGAQIGQAGMMSGDFHFLFFPPEAVGEFKVMTLTVPAEYGQSGLGITAFTLKSGSNTLHGNAWEMLRNDDLDARGFFASTVPLNKQNEFGATVGGPIVIPHIYNGRDKTFFFGWYHGYRWAGTGGANAKDTLPTAAMKQGNLSNLPVPIYDPTSSPDPGLRTLVPGNIIPPNEIDPLAKKIFSYFQDPPACPTCQFGYVQNWLTGYKVNTTINDFGGKVDHNISDKNRIMGDFVWWHNYTPGGSKWPGAISEGALAYTQQDIARFSDDYSFSPTLVNHAVVGYTRYRNDSFPTAGIGWPAKLGYSGVPQTGPGSTFVEMDIGDLGNTYARGAQGYSANNTYTIDDSLTWSKNRHTIKAGFSYIKIQANGFGSTYQSSYLRFNSGATALPGPNYNNGCPAAGTGGCSGAGVASFLFGQVDYGQAGVTAANTADRLGRYAGYVMDDWKITPKLTLNLGLRYDLMLPSVNAHNQWSWMDPNAINPNLGIKGAQVWAAPGRRAGATTDTHELGPRIGLAYAINDKTVLRSAYGIIYSAGGAERDAATSWEQIGYSASNSVAETQSYTYGGTTYSYAGLVPGTVSGHSDYHMILSNGWPAQFFAVPPFKNPSAGVGAGLPSFGAYPNDGHLPYLQDWTLDIQRELPHGILLDVAYVGTKGTHLPSRLMNSNATPTYYMTSPQFQYTDSTGALQNYIFQPLQGAAQQALPIVQHMPVDPQSGFHAPYPGFFTTFGNSVPLAQALRPMPQFVADTVEGLSQVRDFGETVGNSSYNALQIQARKHFSQNLSFLASYTYSKSLTDAESQYNEFSGFTQDFYNARGEKSVSMNDYPNNVTLAYEYLLPFGPGQKFANHGGLAGRVVGGWTISGVQSYTSGAPTMIVYGGAVGNVPSGNPYMGPNGFIARANVVPGVPKKSAALRNGTWDPNGQGAQGAIYNLAAWTAPPEFTLGTAPREDSSARKFGWLNEDISVIKRTNITERVNIELRADFLNIFNRTVFGFDQGGDQYGTVIGGSSIGGGVGSFGHVSAQANFPREVQFGLKINY